MITAFIDFETTYSKEVSITTLGAYNYLNHPETDIYMVAIDIPELDYSYVGVPEGADQAKLDLVDIFVAHNAAFDKLVFFRLYELGIWDVTFTQWHCTADMCAALSYPRSLKDAAQAVLGVQVSKEVRDELKGLTRDDIVGDSALWARTCEYCARDTELCRQLYDILAPQMGQAELFVSALNRTMTHRGLNIDVKKLDEGIETLNSALTQSLLNLPWAGEYTPLSKKGLAVYCNKYSIPCPASVAKDSQEFAEWVSEYGDKYDFVAEMGRYRSINALKKKLDALKARTDEYGIFRYGLKYFGAHTGRFSGDAGFNVQNLPRDEKFGVNLRNLIIPREGYVFVITDLAQIEQRIISWLAGDNETMRLLGTGMSPYEAYARKALSYKEEEPLKKQNPKLYQLAKAIVLGLGFGAGAATFAKTAKTLAGVEITRAEADRLVYEFRRSNPLITSLWRNLENKMRLFNRRDWELELPSGRKLVYRNVTREPKGLTAKVQGKKYGFYGGKLAENLTQAVARDVLADALFRLSLMRGVHPVLTVHDEIVIEVRKDEAEEKAKEIHELMKTPPAWLVGCPLDAETFISDCYTK